MCGRYTLTNPRDLAARFGLGAITETRLETHFKENHQVIDNILLGFIANVLTTVVYALIGLVIFLVFFVMGRRRLLRFFGITKKSRYVKIYTSRIEVNRGGSTGFISFDPSEGYVGPAINSREFEAARLLASTFSSQFLAILPTSVRDIMASKFTTFSLVEPVISVADKEMDNINFQNLIVLGSQTYSAVASYYLSLRSLGFDFVNNIGGEHIIRIRGGTFSGFTIPGRSENRELAVLQRIYDSDRYKVVILCAGLGSNATYGSARYLVEHWNELFSIYHDNEFAICLAFDGLKPESTTIGPPIVIHSISPLT